MPSGNPERLTPAGLVLPREGTDGREAFLVLPGLNIHPHRLDALSALLQQAGAVTFAPRLTGFAEPGDPALRRVRAEHWLADLDAAWAEVRARLPAAEPALLGFSLGGVLGLVWSLTRGIPLRRAALLAPAFRLKRRHRWVMQGLRPLLPGALTIPSLTPRAYRFHPRTSLAAYRAVGSLERRLAPRLRRWLRGEAPGLPPLLIAYPPRDELLDTRPYTALAAALPERVALMPLAHRPRAGYLRHLGLDPFTLGEAEWQRYAATLADWLRRTAPGTHAADAPLPTPEAVLPGAAPLEGGQPE